MKTIMIIFLLIFSICTKGQVKFESEFNVGWTDWSKSIYTSSKQFRVHSSDSTISLFTEINLKIGWKSFEFRTSVVNWMDNTDIINLSPVSIEYTLGVYYSYKFLNIGIEHSCTHPVTNGWTASFTNSYRASYERVYMGIKFGNY